MATLMVLACTGEGTEDKEPNEDSFVAQSALGTSRHYQTTRAGVTPWVNASTANRLTDISTIGDSDSTMGPRSESHFDNCYWNESRDWILLNRSRAVQNAITAYETGSTAALNEAFRAIGFMLHTAEDFYAHSNWVETHDLGVLAGFNIPGALPPSGWISGTYNNAGDNGPNAGAAHCPAATPTHAQMAKDGAGGPLGDEAFAAATLEVSRQMQLLIAAVRATAPASKVEGVLGLLGFLPTPPATTATRTDFRRAVTVSGGTLGLTAPAVYCQPGTYAAAFAQQVEPNQGRGDDTALNSVYLFCKTRSGNYVEQLSQWQGVYGNNSPWVGCPTASGFLTGAELKVEAPQGSGDDTGANAVRFWCNDTANALTATNDGPWGTFRGRTACGPGEAVCGVQVQYEPPQAAGDDTSMNGLILHCCAL